MPAKSWSEFGDRVAPPGSLKRQVVDKLKAAGTMTYEDFIAWLRKDTDYVPEGFTDSQLGTALNSLYDVLENYGAIELDENEIRYIGG